MCTYTAQSNALNKSENQNEKLKLEWMLMVMVYLTKEKILFPMELAIEHFLVFQIKMLEMWS